MPFDGQEAQFETPAIRRARLIEALRNVPPHYEWDFRRVGGCGTPGCALGLAIEIGVMRSGDNVVETFGLPKHSVWSPFAVDPINKSAPYYGCAWDKVTPAMVADALEKIG